MKYFASLFALAIFAITVNHPAYADDYEVSLSTATATDVLVETPILDGAQFTYTNTDVGLLGVGGALLSASTSVFTATYTDVAGTLGVLNVTDVCTSVDILGPATPCQAFAFSFTDLTLLDASIVAAIGVDASVDANVANFNVASADIAGGTASYNFGNPPPSPTPEPSSLCLLATGLLGTAGAVRQRMMARLMPSSHTVVAG